MRTLIILATAMLLSGCSVFGFQGSPQQQLEAKAVHSFVSSIGPRSHRLNAAYAVYQPRLRGHNPYFGRQ